MINCVDFFSGCGGMSLGFENSGINVQAAFDNWERAIQVYKKNFNHPCHVTDLSNEDYCVDLILKYQPDMIIGGPPCQDFSSAGKRDETLGRADLTYHFANIVDKYKPEWFVMENVERIKKSLILQDICEQFSDSGYGLTAVVLDASYCSVPQTRKRFFLIGHLGGVHDDLSPILSKNLSRNRMTIRDYLGDDLNLQYYYRHPRNYSRRGVFSIDEPSPTIRGVNRPVPAGYTKHKGDPDDIDLKELRPLTTIERSYLQTFPKSFVFKGTKTDLEQMIGNAVPVNLANFVAKAIIEFIEDENEKANLISNQQGSLFDSYSFKIPCTTLERAKLSQQYQLTGNYQCGRHYGYAVA